MSRVLAVVLLAALVAYSAAVTVPASADVTIYKGYPSNANSLGSYLLVGGTTAAERRSLVYFDVSSVVGPGGASDTPTEIVLNLYMNDASATDPVTLYVHFMYTGWTEGPAIPDALDSVSLNGVSAATPDPTWNAAQYASGAGAKPWTSPGGDYASSASASIVVSAKGPVTISSSGSGNNGLLTDYSLMKSAVLPNYGWIITTDSFTDTQTKRFGSRSFADPTQRPTLTINFGSTSSAPTTGGSSAPQNTGPTSYIDFTKPAPYTAGSGTLATVSLVIGIVIPGIIFLVAFVITITIRLRRRY